MAGDDGAARNAVRARDVRDGTTVRRRSNARRSVVDASLFVFAFVIGRGTEGEDARSWDWVTTRGDDARRGDSSYLARERRRWLNKMY